MYVSHTHKTRQRDMLEFAAECARESSKAIVTDGLCAKIGFIDLCLEDASMIAMAGLQIFK